MFRFGDPGGRMYGSFGAANVNLLAWWTSLVVASGSLTLQGSGGRVAGSCLRFFNNFANEVSLAKQFDSQQIWGVAFAVRQTAVGAYGTTSLAALRDSGALQCDVRTNADQSLSVTRNGTVLGTTPAGALPLGAWTHIEFKAKIDPSAGTADLWVNGVQKIHLTGVNTRATANSTANQVVVGAVTPAGGQVNTDLDDVIVYDGQATDANGNADITGPVGDCGLAWLLPTGAGTTTQFTPDTGTNYARVNEATPDGDTSYVESGTVGNIDTYAMADLPAGATAVKAVASVHYARKTDVGSRGLKAELRSGGGNAAHAAEIALGNSYQYYFSNWGRDPNNGTPADWTVAAVNALEAGQTVSS